MILVRFCTKKVIRLFFLSSVVLKLQGPQYRGVFICIKFRNNWTGYLICGRDVRPTKIIKKIIFEWRQPPLPHLMEEGVVRMLYFESH